MNNEIILTPEGYKELEQRLENLKINRRAEVAEKIKTAREFGDISENAEYDAAKDEQSMLEGEISEIENQLRTAKIIDNKKLDTSTVSIGCTVRLKDMERETVDEYKLVGTTESDQSQKKISNESPVGKAILGRKKNDIVSVQAPVGVIKMKIMEIK